jgi:hypothetical protein
MIAFHIVRQPIDNLAKDPSPLWVGEEAALHLAIGAMLTVAAVLGHLRGLLISLCAYI